MIDYPRAKTTSLPTSRQIKKCMKNSRLESFIFFYQSALFSIAPVLLRYFHEQIKGYLSIDKSEWLMDVGEVALIGYIVLTASSIIYLISCPYRFGGARKKLAPVIFSYAFFFIFGHVMVYEKSDSFWLGRLRLNKPYCFEKMKKIEGIENETRSFSWGVCSALELAKSRDNKTR